MNNSSQIRKPHTDRFVASSILLSTFIFVFQYFQLRSYLSNTLLLFQEGQNAIASTPDYDAATSFRRLSKSEEDSVIPLASQPFPRWGDYNNDNNNGISIDTLIEFAYGVARKTATTVTKRKPRARFPETLYTVDSHYQLWTSQQIRDRTWKPMIASRVEPMEQLAVLALQELQRQSSNHKWPWLQKSIQTDQVGFPFFNWYGDYRSCNHHNWNNEQSIPLFTVCASVNCTHAFPIPSYEMIQNSKKTSTDWDAIFHQANEEDYTWESKIPQLLWRGSLSDFNNNNNNNNNNDDDKSPRWRLSEYARKLQEQPDSSSSSSSSSSANTLLNIGLTQIPDHVRSSLSLPQETTTKLAEYIPMVDFQKYRAVLDIDGNAWSSRFVNLLCSNSVVFKVQPQYVDYFHSSIQPWVHYIPISSDYSDLIQHATYAMDPANDQQMQTMVQNANEWCRHHMLQTSLAHDLLDTWDKYIELLYQYDPDWSQKWKVAKEDIFSETDLFDMIPIYKNEK